jgi:hypothetical protein
VCLTGSGWKKSSDHLTDDATPSQPIRHPFNEILHHRRSSLLGSIKADLVSETAQISLSPKRGRRSSLLGSFSRWAGNDSAHVSPSRRQSMEMKTRRGSLLGSTFSSKRCNESCSGSEETLNGKADSSPDKPSRRGSIINHEGRRRSLLGSFSTAKSSETEKTLNSKADSSPDKPSRRGYIINVEDRRRSLLGSFSSWRNNESGSSNEKIQGDVFCGSPGPVGYFV